MKNRRFKVLPKTYRGKTEVRQKNRITAPFFNKVLPVLPILPVFNLLYRANARGIIYSIYIEMLAKNG